MRLAKLLICTAGFSLATSLPAAFAQVHESANGYGRHLWGGIEFSDFNPDYNHVGGRLTGIGFYGDYFLTNRVGAEGEIRLLDFKKPAGQTQKSFLAGPIVNVYTYGKLTGYVKFVLGAGTVNYPYNIGYGSYFELAPGGGVEYLLGSRWKIRGEYEHQFMPAAPGLPGYSSNGLTPVGYSVGISYRIY